MIERLNELSDVSSVESFTISKKEASRIIVGALKDDSVRLICSVIEGPVEMLKKLNAFYD